MKLLRREEIWIHTHFVTDCSYLPEHFAREIREKMDRVLERLGLVFGIHFDSRGDEGLGIVLECIPLRETMEKAEGALREIIGPIPARPRRTKVQIEPAAGRIAVERR